MDLSQTKLTLAEWNSIEIIPAEKEMQIMKMIMDGYTNLDITFNRTQTLLGFFKIEQSETMDTYLFNKYILSSITGLKTEKKSKKEVNNKKESNKIADSTSASVKADMGESLFIQKLVEGLCSSKNIVLKSADQIRIQNIDTTLQLISEDESESKIYELFLATQIRLCIVHKHHGCNTWNYYYFTLSKMSENIKYIDKMNSVLKNIMFRLLELFEADFRPAEIIYNASKYIEKNKALLLYKNEQLYPHQKQLFATIKRPEPKLILYNAPTGTGKTMSPIGINKKIIFVCAARHVGLALARTSIAMGKKIGFAFGASCAEDVRLHYAAATDYSRNKKSGKIQKVDNTKGEKVDLMICDIKSYIPAMYYMIAFNQKEDIVMYWDEVTISMDYESHELHNLIRAVWTENVIPNVVFSSATVPKMDDLGGLRFSYNKKFPDGTIHTINSFDCVKSITMINPEGYVVLPHLIFDNYHELQETVRYWHDNGTILRYFDAKEIGDFIRYIEKDGKDCVKAVGKIENNFESASDIHMTSVKQHYMRILQNILPECWATIYAHFQSNRSQRIVRNSSIDAASTTGIFITTKDAYTLTDGPTYFFTNDVNKIAAFYIQQSNIPISIMSVIMETITQNAAASGRMEELEHALSDAEATTEDNKEKNTNTDKNTGISKNPKLAMIQSQIDGLRTSIKSVKLHDIFVPNKPEHVKKWTKDNITYNKEPTTKPYYFTSNITDDIVIRIMRLHNVDNTHKILLLMGIGVFNINERSLNPEYLEIMKTLAYQQRLYTIIANSDYMWGTNYQACHGYFSKDLCLTQDKIIQGMGRVGRGNVQQEYTVRFRDNHQIRTLLCPIAPENKLETINMNQLFG